MEKYDIISTKHFPIATGMWGNMLGIINNVDFKERKFTFNVLDSKNRDDRIGSYFVGMELECDFNEINWLVNDISFPYDYPGCMLYGHQLYGEDLHIFREKYRILNNERFKDLINFIRFYDKEKDFESLILEFLDKENWNREWFLQGCKKSKLCNRCGKPTFEDGCLNCDRGLANKNK